MDFNPDDALQYIEDAGYPASKEEVVSTAEGNGAPEQLVGRLGSLPRPEFSSVDEVLDELRAFPGAG